MSLVQLSLGIMFFGLIYNVVSYISAVQRKRRTMVVEKKKTSADKIFRDFITAVGAFGINRPLLERQNVTQKWELLLIRSGNPFNWKVPEFLAVKEVSLLVTLLVGTAIEVKEPLIWAAIAFLGFQAPDIYLRGRMATRMAQIQRNIPGFIDLIALALESGLDLLAAIERIIEKMKPNALRDELQQLLQENRLGTPRKEALQHLASRVELPDIQALTQMIIQSEELGTSLASVLRTYAEDMRAKRILLAEEYAGKAPVKIMLPMMVFFFPIVFIVILGPIVYNYFNGPH